MAPSEWSDYLDALDGYLDELSEKLESKQAAAMPTLVARKPDGPMPAAETARARSLLEKTRFVTLTTQSWINEILVSMRNLDSRRRSESRPPGRVVSVL